LYYICIFFVCLFVVLFVRVLVHVGQTWPSSLDIISTAFNCSHDTESEFIWLWFMGSYLYVWQVITDQNLMGFMSSNSV
jgi:hypothetical protein